MRVRIVRVMCVRAVPMRVVWMMRVRRVRVACVRVARLRLEPPRDDDPVCGSFELELALVSALMLLFLPVVWIHYYLLLAAPLAILPAWWSARQLPVRWGVSVLLVAGLWLASGSEVRGNHYYGRHHESWQFRIQQNAQPLGAVLLVLGLCAPLAEIARRQRLRANVSRESR